MSEQRKQSHGYYLNLCFQNLRYMKQCAFHVFPWWLLPRYLKALRAAALKPQETPLLETPPVKTTTPALETPAKTLRKALFQEVAAKQSATTRPTPNQLVAAPESHNAHSPVAAGFNISLESIVAFERSADALGKGPSYAKKHETFVSTMAFQSWKVFFKSSTK